MAQITQTDAATTTLGAVNVARTVLTAADTLVYQQGSRQMLFLYNTTASPVVVTINGTSAQTITVPGYGGTVSTSAGKAVTVPATGATLVDLDDISAFCQGTVNVTNGTGVVAILYT
jgi:hypothetical protein